MVVADRIGQTFVKQIELFDGAFVRTEHGLWQGRLAGLSLHGVELREAYKAGASERLLYTFTRAHLDAPSALVPLDNEECRVYYLLAQQIQQFRRHRTTMALKDLELAAKPIEEIYRDFLRFLPPEDARAVIESYPPEIRLAGLTPEQRFAGLTPEQIIAALPSELRELIERGAKAKT